MELLNEGQLAEEKIMLEEKGTKIQKWKDPVSFKGAKGSRFLSSEKVYTEHRLLANALVKKGEAVLV